MYCNCMTEMHTAGIWDPILDNYLRIHKPVQLIKYDRGSATHFGVPWSSSCKCIKRGSAIADKAPCIRVGVCIRDRVRVCIYIQPSDRSRPRFRVLVFRLIFVV